MTGSVRIVSFLVLMTAAVAIASVTTAKADSTLSLKVGGDDIAIPHRSAAAGECQPCGPSARPGDAITEYVAKGRARRDRGPMSTILDTDAGKVYFICNATRRYAEVDYPVSYQNVLDKHYSRLGDLVEFKVTEPATKTSGQVGQWKVDIFEATVANGLRDQYRIRTAVAGTLPDADAPLMALLGVLNEIAHGGHGWSRFLPFTTGLPVVWETRQRQPETEFVYREEVLKIDSAPLDAARFKVPEGYAKVRYDSECMTAP